MPGRSDLLAFVLAIVRDPGLAALALRRLPPGAESFQAAREAALEVCRRRKRRVPLSEAAIDALQHAASSSPDSLAPATLRSALGRVGGQPRSLLAMRYRKGMSLPLIARRVKETVHKTQQALHRARLLVEKAAGP